MVERIVIEIVTPGDSRTMFRALMDRLVVEENLVRNETPWEAF